MVHAIKGVRAKIGVLADAHVGVGPEPDVDRVVVQPRVLGLYQSGEVLIAVILLTVFRTEQQVTLVRVPGRAGAEVAGDDVGVVDAEQLVEGQVVVVVQ